MAPEPRYILTEDNFAALIRLFTSPANPKWFLPQHEGGYADNTKYNWRRELSFMSRPECLGALKIAEIRPALVQAFFDGMTGRPGKQHLALTALRALEKWSIVRDLLPRQITLGIAVEDSGGGHIPWEGSQVATAQQYARADLAQLVTLGAHTGQRVSDLIRMGWSDVSTHKGLDGIRVIQRKTGREVWVPILGPLETAMAAWPRQPGPFLRRMDGAPWLLPRLVNAEWTYERKHNPELTEHRDIPLVIHGLRSHCCVKFSRRGLSDHQIGDMIGMSIGMVGRYTRHSHRQDNAVAAVISLERTMIERGRSMSPKTGS